MNAPFARSVSLALDTLLRPFAESARDAPDFATVRRQRDAAETLDRQRALALEDRRAFAREFTQENPFIGPLAIAVLSPAEQVVKSLGFQQGRSGFFDPLANIGAGFQGALEGLAQRRLPQTALQSPPAVAQASAPVAAPPAPPAPAAAAPAAAAPAAPAASAASAGRLASLPPLVLPPFL